MISRNPIAKTAKKWIKGLLGMRLGVKSELQCETRFLGSAYGGYSVCPTKLPERPIVYSFGVGEDISFDLAAIEALRAQVFAFDPTEKSIAWLRSQKLPADLKFFEFGLAGYDGIARFSAPENPEHVSYSVVEKSAAKVVEAQVRRLKTLMDQQGHTRIDILKMDIEGAEYDALTDILASGIPIGQLLVEFHHRMPQIGNAKTMEAIRTLRANGFRLFYISESEEEFSFLRVDSAG